MTTRLFWVAAVSVLVCVGVLYALYAHHMTRWHIVVEDVPFIDYEGRTPTKEEIAERMVEAYTKCRHLSFDCQLYNYAHRYWTKARYRAAAGRFRTDFRVWRLTKLGRGPLLFDLTLWLKDGVIHEEWVRAKDGSRLVKDYPAPLPTGTEILALEDDVPEHICGMTGGGIMETIIDNPEEYVLNGRAAAIPRMEIIGTTMMDGQRCVVLHNEESDTMWKCMLVISPDYFVVHGVSYRNTRLAFVFHYSEFSTQPLPDSAWE